MNNLNLNRHDWKFYGPSSLYDTTYKCKNCNGHHTESTDDINSTLPAFGCTVKDESIIPKTPVVAVKQIIEIADTLEQLINIVEELEKELELRNQEIAKLKNNERVDI